MANITKVPNGPLIKKKGQFKGSTLKTGGSIKKAQDGDYKIGKKTYTTTRAKDDTIQRPKQPVWVTNPMGGQNAPYVKTKKNKGIDSLIDRATRGYKTGGSIKKAQTGATLTAQQKRAKLDSITAVKRAEITRKKDSILNRNAAAQGLTREQVRAKQEADKKKQDATNCNLSGQNSGPDGCKAIGKAARARNKNGGMIKRADGSMSRRGLWDNIRKNKGSGKKPTKQMLVQEKKIKAKTKK